MSSTASSGERPADIIDLDRYMRASVLPSRIPRRLRRCDGLVVDAGGVERTAAVTSSGDGASPRAPPRTCPTAHHKRHSHDSGVSDSSYLKRRRKLHKRSTESSRSRASSRRDVSASSMREFRVVCERALREQQLQIARVTQLCERLASPAAEQSVTRGPERHQPRGTRSAQRSGKKKAHAREITTDSSDFTCGSRNSRDVRRQEDRSDSCKTYKLIIDRLEDLSRVFATRRAPLTPRPAPPSSVTLCDKLVATDMHKPQLSFANTTPQAASRDGQDASGRAAGGGRPALAVVHAHLLDVTPVRVERVNVVTESVVHRGESSGDQLADRSLPDLDDPVHFYAQAKRLQALHATAKYEESRSAAGPAPAARGRGLCALCRFYWRALRDRLTQVYTSMY